MNAVQELRYLLSKTHPGWEVIKVNHEFKAPKYELYAGDWDYSEFRHQASAEFCAAARNLLPEVLAELDALRNELAALKEVARG